MIVEARLCATRGGFVPAPTRLPARSHPGVSAGPQAPRQACGADRCGRKSTLDPRCRLLHTQPRALEMTIFHILLGALATTFTLSACFGRATYD
jgi:hypothetical protein